MFLKSPHFPTPFPGRNIRGKRFSRRVLCKDGENLISLSLSLLLHNFTRVFYVANIIESGERGSKKSSNMGRNFYSVRYAVTSRGPNAPCGILFTTDAYFDITAHCCMNEQRGFLALMARYYIARFGTR